MMSQEDPPETLQCATHPGVETSLRCGRCEKPICPRCVVMTPGGQRCIECAHLRPPPQYEITALQKLKAVAVATAVGLVAGILWALIPPVVGFFIFLLAAGLGYLMAEAISRVTNRKRGYVLQLTAGLGILLAYFVRNWIQTIDLRALTAGHWDALLSGTPILFHLDLFGYLAVAIAIVVAISPLR